MSLSTVTPELQTPAMIGTDEVASALGCHPQTVRNLARRRAIPSIRLGSRVLKFNLNDVLAALRGGRLVATPKAATRTPGLDVLA